MQQLHLVGFTTDRRGLIFSVRRGAKSGSFQVQVGDDLFAAIDEARARLEEEAAEAHDAALAADRSDRPQSNLAVREIQARLRQGQSLDAVAAKAGVDASWVARFAAPVETEMAEVVRRVRAKRYVKQRVGTSGATLGESVYRNLADRGVRTPRDELDRGWSARQMTDGQWEVRFAYVSRGKSVTVSWLYDDATRKVVGRDRLATQLAFRPGGPPLSKRGKTRSTAAGAAAVAEAAAEDPPRPAAAKAAAKRVAAARKAARARMVADAEKATRRNVAVARKAAKRKPRARPLPPPDAEIDEVDALDALEDVEDDLDVETEESFVDADEVGDLDDVGDLDELDEIDDEEAVTARPHRPSVPARRRLTTNTDFLLDLDGDGAEVVEEDNDDIDEDDFALDLAWLHEREPEADTDERDGHDGHEVAAADDAVVAEDAEAAVQATSTRPPGGARRRREPLRARPSTSSAASQEADAATDAAATPKARVRVRTTDLDLSGGTAGAEPVFRRDLARRAADDDGAPPAPASPPRRRPLRPS